ncbi:MAG: PAS domain-containing sensor histidine kinase [Deltaproteobacteria bacterium]|nr:PAS domain-containing sensor histidine kinase [Deltaproteobacteria bacterium]
MEAKLTYAELEHKITELTQKVQEQIGIENQYRNLVDSTSDSLYLVDIHGRYLFMNSNHAQRLNIPKGKTTGLAFRDFHTPEQSAEFESKIRTVFETGISIHDEHQGVRKGEYFLRTISPVRDPADPQKINAVCIVSKDITKRRKNEEALLKSEEKYRQLIEHSNEAIFIITDGKITYANRCTERMLGYTAYDLKLISFINLVISEDREMVFEQQKIILRGDTPAVNISFRIVNKENATIWVATNSVPILWENVPATLNFMHDITGQKKTETRLLQAQKMESIGTLAGGIAHDFNNLLMGIQGHTSLALLKLGKNDPTYEHIKTIETLVLSGAGLTRQLLGFARGGKYEVKQVDLNDLIDKTSETIGRTKKEIHIHREFEPHLWSTDIDQGQIEQVLLNLFVNAWQAMPGGGDLYIETKNVGIDESRFRSYNGKSGRYVKISVTDTGVGMDEKTKERIFEPFFTTKEMGRGTGLGLASVYGIIKNHNGFINVYSEKGQGSTFNIYLPASVKKDEKDRISDSDSAMAPMLYKETILLIDDEAIILDVAGEMLETMGYTVIVAQNGPTALDIYRRRQEDIDLVILDMVMPDMGGGEIFNELKKINSRVKVLLSSGYSLNGQAGKIIERGCSGFIQKPFTIGDISRQLRKILEQSPAQPKSQEPLQIPLPIFDSP